MWSSLNIQHTKAVSQQIIYWENQKEGVKNGWTETVQFVGLKRWMCVCCVGGERGENNSQSALNARSGSFFLAQAALSHINVLMTSECLHLQFLAHSTVQYLQTSENSLYAARAQEKKKKTVFPSTNTHPCPPALTRLIHAELMDSSVLSQT